jgi:hypothetical protein
MRIVLAALCLASAAAAQDYPLPVHALGGKDPRAVVVADFDLDGRPDFASAQFIADRVAIVLAAPGGDFEPPIQLEVGNGYTDLGVGDFDLDGRPDLVATNQLDPWLRIFDNDSGWTWCGATGAIVANALAVGDIDGDGRPDVVVADSFSNLAQVFLTTPSGCPGAPVGFATGAKPVDVVVADFDGDGALDVVTCNETAATLSLLRGDGAGGLLPATSVAVGFTPTALVAADLDQDGDADVAVSGSAASKVRPFLGDGAGGLLGGTSLSFPGTKPGRLVAADLDDDGLLDLVVAQLYTATAGGFAVLRGTGGGTFAAPAGQYFAVGNSGALAVADMDEDGRLDVLLDETDDSIFIAPGDGTGGFLGPPGPQMPETSVHSTLGDLNGDGADDLVSSPSFGSPSSSGPVSVQLGDGAGDWLAAAVQPAEASDVLHLADLDGNGTLDLLTSDAFNVLSASLGDGAGGLGPSVYSLAIEAVHLATADIDGDGKLDAIVDGEEPTFFGDPQFMLKVYKGNGTGAFVPMAHLLTYDSWDPFGGSPKPLHGHVQAGDLDGDGDPDIVFSGLQQSRVWLNVGGSLGAGSAIAVNNGYAYGIDALRLADFDGDGQLDMLTVNDSHVSVLYGNGVGGFGPAVNLALIQGGDSLAVADVDQDGLLDLLVGRSGGETVEVLHNDGEGGVTVRAYYSGGSLGLHVSDVDGDGYPDVLTEAFGGNRLLLNQALHGAWADLGSGLAGVDGVPKLVGTGTLGPGSPGTLKLSHANPSKLCALFVSKTSTPAPFKGGVLVTVPPLASFLLFTSPAGTVNLSWAHWPPGPAGATWYFQYAIVDSAGPAGASLSNAVRGTQPGP